MPERVHKVTVRLTDEEYTRLLAKMNEVGVGSMSLYIRKMMLDGYCVKLKTDDFGEIVYLLRMCSNNLNQYAKKANGWGEVHARDIRDLKKRFEDIWDGTRALLRKFSSIK